MKKFWTQTLIVIGTTAAVGAIIMYQKAPLIIGIPTSSLVWMQLILLVVVFVVMPVLSMHMRKEIESDAEKKRDAGRRAFNLPRGSIRAMLALFSIGSFVNVLALGPGTIPDEYFDK